MDRTTPVIRDAWLDLRSATSARIALGRAGGSLPTHEWLDFKAAHAAARDAVHCAFDAERHAHEIRALGAQVVIVDSRAADRHSYLQRPDLGRRLDDRSQYFLQELPLQEPPPDLAIIVTDGLSALAVHRHAVPLLEVLLPRLSTDHWNVTPIVVARFGRVALQDEVGYVLSSQLALILIGERPGLGSPDSLGAYLVYGPRPGNTDARRNCVCNIRPEGLRYNAAAETIHYLLSEARRRKLSGVELKDQRALS